MRINPLDYYREADWNIMMAEAAKHETPFVVVNLNIIKEQYESLRDSFPFADIYYAVKANPAREIVEMLRDLGSSFDVASVYELNHLLALHVDPVEKKPLYHFLPGTKTFSLGTFGCTLGCRFCQNDTLSAQTYDQNSSYRYFSPEEIVTLALQYKCESVAFTYNEPTVFAEYLLDVADLAHEKGLKTLMVTNGFLAEESAEEIFSRIDAANIDMKGYSQEFYSSMCAGRLQDVLRNIKLFYHMEGKHLELTNLIIPGKNDSEEMIHAYLDFVEQNLSRSVPLHFSAYFPAFLYRASPPTDPETIRRIVNLARSRGFENVHAGNI